MKAYRQSGDTVPKHLALNAVWSALCFSCFSHQKELAYQMNKPVWKWWQIKISCSCPDSNSGVQLTATHFNI
jgi:hypothetical protein